MRSDNDLYGVSFWLFLYFIISGTSKKLDSMEIDRNQWGIKFT